MEKYIISNQANCKYCYKCLRNCPVKSISFSDNISKVIDSECILCGKCIEVCPQDAKNYLFEYERLKDFFGKKFFVSIAPSFFSYFDEPFKIISYLKKNGAIISETSVGAELVSKEYEKLSGIKISTACPVVVNLVEKYYPEKIKYLSPVVSPAIAHARFLKQYFGNYPLVFIGPCIAKKRELEKEYDLVLTFEELEKFLESENIDILDFEDDFPQEPYPKLARFYPISGGILKTLGETFDQVFNIEGVKNIKDFLDRVDDIDGNYFVEMSACIGGCIEGPASRKDISQLEKRIRLSQNIKKIPEGKTIENVELDLKRKFKDKKHYYNYTEQQIQEVLFSIGKTDKSKELNCSACGYDTCREKAIAVLEKKAEKEMCITYLIDKVSTVSNMVVEETPNLILIVKDGNINYKNKAARLTFMSLSNKKLWEFLKDVEQSGFKEIAVNSKNLKFFVKRFNLPEDSGEVFILTDVTKELEQEERVKIIKKHTIEKIEEVLNKQMLLAQEIASLLGESIAETKSHFTEFKRYMEEENDYL
ncbi:iron only hydrogenase large subunit-like protein [Thermosipho japonicus]|uniref:Iron only hydrogenase large subunit-like protein n=1 Tax=Thermosipho japonicus TaxID=90323 RepID=A0A841GTH7_9BACT|nr:[Fe-Fe] hydrogenase large subunit C-terminal domain-containing protein [Thermosipho japonicus]MBB6062640.1 iron only hydrogenase large subunit-like protein [Thermosipho japonicus]